MGWRCGNRSGNRGGNERMTCHLGPPISRALRTQLPLAEYLGRYVRPPIGEFLVTAAEDGSNQLVLR